MSRYLFRRKSSQKRYYLILMILVFFLIFFFFRNFLEESCEYLGWQFMFASNQENFYQESVKNQEIDKLKIENILLENKLKTKFNEIWKKPSIKHAYIKNILWENMDRWFVTTINICNYCVVINKNGLVGKMDPIYGKGVIKLINNANNLLVVKAKNGKDYLVKGQGYQKPLLVLESDLSFYPPQEGEVVFTSGLDNLYPANILVGVIYKKDYNYYVETFFNQDIDNRIYLVDSPNV